MTGPNLALNRLAIAVLLASEILLDPTLPITVPANHNVAGSVKCYGPDLANNRSS